MMKVPAFKAIYFECGECHHGQYSDYTLDSDWLDDEKGSRAVMADTIDCEKCGKPSKVYEEL